jgi:hypothetical protein
MKLIYNKFEENVFGSIHWMLIKTHFYYTLPLYSVDIVTILSVIKEQIKNEINL